MLNISSTENNFSRFIEKFYFIKLRHVNYFISLFRMTMSLNLSITFFKLIWIIFVFVNNYNKLNENIFDYILFNITTILHEDSKFIFMYIILLFTSLVLYLIHRFLEFSYLYNVHLKNIDISQ